MRSSKKVSRYEGMRLQKKNISELVIGLYHHQEMVSSSNLSCTGKLCSWHCRYILFTVWFHWCNINIMDAAFTHLAFITPFAEFCIISQMIGIKYLAEGSRTTIRHSYDAILSLYSYFTIFWKWNWLCTIKLVSTLNDCMERTCSRESIPKLVPNLSMVHLPW